MAILETKNLTYTYGVGTPFEKTAVQDVSVSIEKGEFVGVIGHTGSGKSTLIQMLNGLIRPTSGQVLLDGHDIWEKPKEIRRVRFQVGMVFQYPEYQLFEETVIKDIMFGPKNMGLSDEEALERAKEAAKFTDLKPELLEKSPFELSGGEKRRAAIAGVIAMDPEVGAIYKGRVTRLMAFGALVEIAPGKEGLVHISKLENFRVNKVEDVVNVGDEILVKVTEIDQQGRINLSRKDAMAAINNK